MVFHPIEKVSAVIKIDPWKSASPGFALRENHGAALRALERAAQNKLQPLLDQRGECDPAPISLLPRALHQGFT